MSLGIQLHFLYSCMLIQLLRYQLFAKIAMLLYCYNGSLLKAHKTFFCF